MQFSTMEGTAFASQFYEVGSTKQMKQSHGISVVAGIWDFQSFPLAPW